MLKVQGHGRCGSDTNGAPSALEACRVRCGFFSSFAISAFAGESLVVHGHLGRVGGVGRFGSQTRRRPGLRSNPAPNSAARGLWRKQPSRRSIAAVVCSQGVVNRWRSVDFRLVAEPRFRVADRSAISTFPGPTRSTCLRACRRCSGRRRTLLPRSRWRQAPAPAEPVKPVSQARPLFPTGAHIRSCWLSARRHQENR